MGAFRSGTMGPGTKNVGLNWAKSRRNTGQHPTTFRISRWTEREKF